MKHLLYLNREYLYSYYSQAFGGIDHTRTIGTTDANASEEHHISETVQRRFGGKGSILNLFHFAGEKQVTDENINSRFITMEAAQEFATVTLHDNALNDIIKHSNAESNTTYTLGSYVIESGHFDIIDFRYWIDTLSDSFISMVADKAWEEHLAKLSKPGTSEMQKGRDQYIKNEKDKLITARKGFQLNEAIMQCDVVMVVNNKIIPIKREYMKETIKELLFKYESPVKVFGRITRQSKNIANNVSGLLKIVNESFTFLWVDTLIRTKTLKNDGTYTVIDPIAIYVE